MEPDLPAINALLAQRVALLEQFERSSPKGSSPLDFATSGSALFSSVVDRGAAPRFGHHRQQRTIGVQTTATTDTGTIAVDAAAASFAAAAASKPGPSPPEPAARTRGGRQNGGAALQTFALDATKPSSKNNITAPPVSCVDWSPSSYDVLLTGYGGALQPSQAQAQASNGPAPVLALWIRGDSSSPLHLLTSSSVPSPIEGVTCARFLPGRDSDGHVIVAGTGSGRLLRWDTRFPSSAPSCVTLSHPSSSAHAFPIVHLAVSNSTSSADDGVDIDMGDDDKSGSSQQPLLVTSVSSDGRVCQWDLAARELKTPLRSFMLQKSSASSSGRSSSSSLSPLPLRPSAITNPSSVDASLWFAGEEDGGMAWGHVPVDAVVSGSSVVMTAWTPSNNCHSNSNISNNSRSGHSCLVTSAHAHPHPELDLLLTASFDGGLRLWTANERRLAPLASFDPAVASGPAGSVVSDVQWSPSNPCVFASVDTGGALRLWHLGRTDRAPALVRQIAPSIPQQPPSQLADFASSLLLSAPLCRGLSRLCWSPDGRHIAVADLAGMLHVIAVGEEFMGRGGGTMNGTPSVASVPAGGEPLVDEEEMAAIKARIEEWSPR